MPEVDKKTEHSHHAEFFEHAKDSHEQSTTMPVEHSGHQHQASDSSLNSLMPCCDDLVRCEHSHCNMSFALVGTNVPSMTHTSMSEFKLFSINLLSQTYDILLPPPAI